MTPASSRPSLAPPGSNASPKPDENTVALRAPAAAPLAQKLRHIGLPAPAPQDDQAASGSAAKSG